MPRTNPRTGLLATIAVLLAIAAVNIYSFRHDFAALARGAVGGDRSEVARWQAFAQHYDRMFGMLAWNRPLAVRIKGRRSSGILIERDGDGVNVRPSLVLARAKPGVLLTIEPAAAEALLATVPHTDPGAIWQIMKDRLFAHEIEVWSDPDLDRLQRDGYLAFLRAFDTRPKGVDWDTIRIRLGEEPRKARAAAPPA